MDDYGVSDNSEDSWTRPEGMHTCQLESRAQDIERFDPSSPESNIDGLEDDQAFKSLFLHNLHESVPYKVTMHSRNGNLAMQDIRKYTQLAWESYVRLARWTEDEAKVFGIQASESGNLALEGNEMLCAKQTFKSGPLRTTTSMTTKRPTEPRGCEPYLPSQSGPTRATLQLST